MFVINLLTLRDGRYAEVVSIRVEDLDQLIGELVRLASEAVQLVQQERPYCPHHHTQTPTQPIRYGRGLTAHGMAMEEDQPER
jgi:hypothetical protein